MRGDLDDYTHWESGISRAIKFMSSARKCPTTCAIIHKLQKEAKKAKKVNAKKGKKNIAKPKGLSARGNRS